MGDELGVIGASSQLAAEPSEVTLAAPTRVPVDNNESTVPDVGRYVTPMVRRLAADNNLDLTKVAGTGVGGRVRKEDVLNAVPAPMAASVAASVASSPSVVTPSVHSGAVESMTRLRKVIAARMVESLQVSAQLSCWVEADVTRIAKLREQTKADFEAREGQKLNVLPFFARAVIAALKVHPKLNASIDIEKGEITYHPHVHLGPAPTPSVVCSSQ